MKKFTTLFLAVVIAATPVIASAGNNHNNHSPKATIVATKIVCAFETDLPNWGEGAVDITEDTAVDFLTTHPNCHAESGWDFQWGYSGVTDPGATIIGEASNTGSGDSEWKSFGPTDNDGEAVARISDVKESTSDRIWVREVLQDNYLAFSEPVVMPVGQKNAVSAELYCHDDVLNYDNFDFVLSPQYGSTYHCVAFNVLATTTATTTPPSVPVNNPPVLTITGNNPLEIVENTVFIDPGATSTDVEDGDLTASIIVNGSVNASTTGSYTLTYSVTDSKGSNVSANRIVNVVPAPVIPPSCSNLSTMTGWYGNYFDYSALHTDMEENPSTWGNAHGDPLSVASSWTADWYDTSYKKFERVDANIEFGGNFFPMDSVAGAEITNGHNYHFGSVWTAKVTASTTGNYAYTLTSDDDAWVYVDGVLKVDNSLIHAPQTKTGSINLTAGTHTVAIYFAERHTTQSHMHFRFSDASLVITPFNPTCPAPANTAPVITLKGSNPTQVVVNNAFTDQGATSTDAEDGDLTSQIVVTGTVNTAATGTYSINYTVTDSGGLTASTTRVVNVVPAGNNGGPTNTPPQVTLIGNNPFNVATDTAFIDPGATSTDAEDGDLTSAIVVTGSINASTTGSYILTYSVTDSGGLSTSTTRIVIINATTTPTTPGGPTTPTTPTNNGGGSNGGRSGRRHDIGGVVLGTATCTYLEDYLHRDWNNNSVEVMKLQSFLNIFEKETLTVDGVFNQATFDATSRFQNKYASDILTPWGHTAPTGYVYILTKKKVNEIYCNTMIALTVGEQNEIAAFRAFLESLPAGTTPVNNGLPIDLGDYVGVVDEEGGFSVGGVANNVASTVKDTVADITNNTGLRNLAVSLLGSPKGLKEISSTYLFILIGLILIAAFAPRKGGKNSIVAVKTDASATLTPSVVVEAPKAEDFEQPAPLAEEKTEDKKDDENGSSNDKGFKGIIG